MWSDNDIDNAFQRLNPPEPESTPFPLDAWLRLETQLDKAVIERAVRRKLWRFFAAEVVVVALIALGWLLWHPSSTPALVGAAAGPAAAINAGGATAGAETANERSHNPATEPAAKPTLPATAGASEAPAALPTAPAASAPAASVPAHMKAPSLGSAKTTALPGVAHAHGSAVPVLVAASSNASRKPARTPEPAANAENRVVRHRLGNGLAAAALPRKAARMTQEQAGRQPRAVAAIASNRGNGAVAQPAPAGASEAAAGTRLAVSGSATGHSRPVRNSGNVAETQLAHGSAAGAVAGTSTETSAGKTPASALSAESAAGPADRAELLLRPVALRPAEFPSVSMSSTATVPAPAPTPAVVRQPRFYVGLVGAPDVSTVKLFSVEAPKANLGLTLEYRLSNRLRLNTGVLRSTKQYEALREDYDWGAYRYLVYQHDFSHVDGTCTVLDVPLNLRYDFLVRTQSRVFGSVGLSSFFMLREHYSYDYEENNTSKEWPIDAVNQNHHLLSIVNLSVGYERSLSTHWSLQAEPYVKVPLAGVGVGKVKLTSAGVFLGVKYGF